MPTQNRSTQTEQTKQSGSKKRVVKGPTASAPQATDQAMLQLALDDPSAVTPNVILKLQQSHGNRAVQRLIESQKTKSDPAETASHPGASPRSTEPAKESQRPSPVNTFASSLSPTLQTKPATPSPEPLAAPEPPGEMAALPVGYVPPVAPPATPPPNDSHSGTTLQTKLTVGAADDSYEREAESVADKVMAASPPAIQRQREDGEDEQIQAKPLANEITPTRGVQRQGAGAGFEVQGPVEDQIQSRSGTGQSLPSPVREKMEDRFGANFQNVSVHTDSQSAQLNRQLSAQAFTHGSDIFFGDGKYDPGTSSGQHLLAHELTHVVQQGGAGEVRRKPDEGGDGPLTSPRLAGNERLQDIASGGDPLSTRDNGKAVRIIQESLIAMGEALSRFGADGKYGDETAQAVDHFRSRHELGSGPMDMTAILVLDKASPSRGGSGEGYLNYEQLLKDDKIDIALAIGFDDDAARHKAMEKMAHDWLKAHQFVIADKTQPGIEAWAARARIEYPVKGGLKEREVAIRLTLITPAVGAAAAFKAALAKSEIVTYAGHARGGLGPDFDPKSSGSENVVIGAHSRRHNKPGSRVKTPKDNYWKSVKHKEQNDMEQMARSGQWDTQKYRVWFFSACETVDYLDEIRNGVLPKEMTRSKLDVFGTTRLMFGGSRGALLPVFAFLEGILQAQSSQQLLEGMQSGLNQGITESTQNPETRAKNLNKNKDAFFHSASQGKGKGPQS